MAQLLIHHSIRSHFPIFSKQRRVMQFSLTKLRLREDIALPSFNSMFPAASSSRSTPDNLVDASMTLGGLPPLNPLLNTTEQHEIETEDASSVDADTAVTEANEIQMAFASLDSEAAASHGTLPLELQCRYRQGKCSQHRTLKKNGSLHSYCEHHRLLSVRNQRVFDQKRRRQRTLEVQEEQQPRRRQSTRTNCSSSDEDEQKVHEEKPPKRRRRTV